MASVIVDQIAPRNFQNGSVTRGTHSLPANFVSVTFQLNCTTGNPAAPFTGFANPFSNPATTITFGMRWSWDGGATFAMSTEGIQNGQPTGIWATDKQGNPLMTPDVDLAAPSQNGVQPNAYQPYASLTGGPVTTGLTVIENTTA